MKACWDAVAHRVFLDVCIEEVNANNRPVQVLTHLGYENNFIRDNKLYDQHFHTFERGSYVQEDSASFTGGTAPSSSDSVMGALRQSIAQGIVD